MKMRFAALGLALTLLSSCIGCTRKTTPARQVIVLIDVSASIEPESHKSAFQAIESLGSSLRRGDSLAVIPISGDATNESQGRLLRLRLPLQREAYDQDLRRAVKSLRRSLDETAVLVFRAPGTRTDILGAFRLAVQECS